MGPVPGRFCQKAESRRLSANLKPMTEMKEMNASTSTYPRKLEEILQANWVKRLFQLQPQLGRDSQFHQQGKPNKSRRCVSPVKFVINSWWHQGAFQSNDHLSRWHPSEQISNSEILVHIIGKGSNSFRKIWFLDVFS